MIVRRQTSLFEVSPQQWDALTPKHFPFADHAFLLSFETSGVLERTGWQPTYFTVWDGQELVGATYVYEKSDSYGEYIFDWAWARAYHAHEIPYYPKLVSSVPFTPATGPKLLLASLESARTVGRLLLQSVREFSRAQNLSSEHFLFVTEDELPAFREDGYLIRHSFQYHWQRQGETDFGGFLQRLPGRRRRMIERERREVKASGIQITKLTGQDLCPWHADVMYRMYLQTIDKKAGLPYLNQEFFKETFQRLPETIVLFLAHESGTPLSEKTCVAAALNYQKGGKLFGRQWGAVREIPFLHFELCYYSGIEHAFAAGLSRFEAGAQGEHKIPRGFLPTLTYSAHYFHHPGFREAIADFVEDEKQAIERYFAELSG